MPLNAKREGTEPRLLNSPAGPAFAQVKESFRKSAHQDVAELPGIVAVHVLWKQPAAIRQRRPIRYCPITGPR